MKKPDIFSDTTPSVFKSSARLEQYRQKFFEWLPDFEKHCLESGLIGQLLQEHFAKTGCRYVFDQEDFTTLTNDLMGGHYNANKNEINVAQGALEEKSGLFYCLFHECIHAVQYDICASVFANPSNRLVPIALTPRDQILQGILIERDAWVKTNFFYYSYEKQRDADTLQNIDDIKQFLVDDSKTILNDNIHDDGKNFYEWYVDFSLSYLQDIAAWHLDYGDKEFDFVRLEEEDIWNAGNSLGINSLFCHREDINTAALSAVLTKDQENQLNIVNQRLGVDEEKVMTFGKALKKHGLTRKDYIKMNHEERNNTSD